MIKTAGEIFIRDIRDAVDTLKSCVTPIIDVNEKGEAELLGSAVLIKLADKTFICTAQHIIEENARSTLYIDGPSKLEVLEGSFYTSKEHDVAAMELTPEQVKCFKKYTPLRDDRIANQTQAEVCNYVEFVGHPGKQNRKVYKQNKLKGSVYSFGCSVLEITPAKVRVSFNRNRNIDSRSFMRVKSPDPHGTSGGAMFGVQVNAATIKGTPCPKLIGITPDCPNSNEVFGTSIAIVMAILRDGWQIELPTRLNPEKINRKTFRQR
jgi:hypothetical protein